MRISTIVARCIFGVLSCTTLPIFSQGYHFEVIEQFQPNGINDKGVVVGQAGAPIQGFYRFDDFLVNVNDPSITNGQTVLFGVNNHGDIVGLSVSGVGEFVRGFVYRNGVFQTLTVPGADQVTPGGINNHGDIYGSYSIGQNTFGFLIKGNQVEKLPYPVAAMNDRGDVVVGLPGGNYLLRNGVMTIITLPGLANGSVSGINDAGVIVGETDTTGFVLKDGNLTQVRYPTDAFFTLINGINNRGQIAGFSIGPAGLTAFIGTPVRDEE
jgi:hypothetical protein